MRRDAGFTLIEMLAVMVALGLLTLLVGGSLRLGLRSWDKSAAMLSRTQDVLAAQALLRRELSQAYPVDLARSGEARRVAFEGARQRMTFVAPMPDWLGFGGFSLLRLERVDDRLELSWSRLASERRSLAPGPDERRVVLLKGVGDMAFDYFGRVGAGPARWMDRWTSAPGLPSHLRLRLLPKDPGVAPWPDMVVSLMVDGAAVIYGEDRQ